MAKHNSAFICHNPIHGNAEYYFQGFPDLLALAAGVAD